MTLKRREEEILGELKDFQRTTVERCFALFKSGQRRVLVADEVGLGKTLIAKGVVAKLANYHKQTGGNLFKVLYICSNTAIANQNIRKLKIYDAVTVDGVSDTRLSMQHLKIFEQEHDPKVRAGYIQLIPLTPATSFTLSSGTGNASERALIYTILSKMPEFSKYAGKLYTLLMHNANKGFGSQVEEMTCRVDACGEDYLRPLTDEVRAMLTDQLLESFMSQQNKFISELRLIFAKISIRRLDPDLVIMDEFQRFRELITATPDSETGMLTQVFLKDSAANTLLLSATPYKLYQTLEETAESGVDEHYHEFLELMRFLFSDGNRYTQFEETWRDFSNSLRKVSTDFEMVVNIKSKAEHEMYRGMCRTERLLVDGSENFIDGDKADASLVISERDIQTFIAAQNLSEKTPMPVEYVKSCPYPLSFMEHYKYKSEIKKQRPEIKPRDRKLLFVDEKKLHSYEALPLNNARLERLKNVAFDKGAEKLLWVPPSIPYYQPGGVFKGKDNFSKVLVFSAWEMVPRMIACMLSYECERQTIGKLYTKEEYKPGKGYLNEDLDKRRHRFPTRRLVDGRDRALTKASVILAGIYNPTEFMGQSIKEIKRALRPVVEARLTKLQDEYGLSSRSGKRELIDIFMNMAIASPAICAMRVFKDDCVLAERFAKEVADMFDKPEAIAVVELAYGKSDDAHYKNVLKYCVDGNFAAMLDEYAHVLNE